MHASMLLSDNAASTLAVQPCSELLSFSQYTSADNNVVLGGMTTMPHKQMNDGLLIFLHNRANNGSVPQAELLNLLLSNIETRCFRHDQRFTQV